MYALQRVLRDANWPWLKIGGVLEYGDIPWFWSWEDAHAAVQWMDLGFPYFLGPNVFFKNSRIPGCDLYEMQLLKARNCLGIFTESLWYERLIRRFCESQDVPIHRFSYPIWPEPHGPTDPQIDLLVYLKTMSLTPTASLLCDRWLKSYLIVYGHYQREELLAAARQSRVCAYLCSDDRGPLALAEILLAGCPAVGVECGAPWVTHPGLGREVPDLGFLALEAACDDLMDWDRSGVRTAAQEYFNPQNAVATIRHALLGAVQ